MDIQKNTELAEEHQSLPSAKTRNLWLGTYLLLALAFLVLYFLLRLRVFEVFGSYRALLTKASMAAFVAMLVLMAAKTAEGIVNKRAKSRSAKYNLVKLIHLLSLLIVCLVFISFLFNNWYTAAVSLGLISLLLGFALQTPISSFIGWVNILIRAPYHVGDRIQIGSFRGDVVEINYMDTTLWECGGDHLTNDLPSGRLIRFPNTLVLQEAVFNYSWRKFPYIWNEIPFYVAYESDMAYVTETLKKVAKQELGEDMEEKIEVYKALLAATPVDELTVREYPFVTLRTHENTWVEVLLIYLVHPKQSGTVRTRLIQKAIAELLKEPGRVMFPNGNSR